MNEDWDLKYQGLGFVNNRDRDFVVGTGIEKDHVSAIDPVQKLNDGSWTVAAAEVG